MYIEPEDMAVWDDRHGYVIEPGRYLFMKRGLGWGVYNNTLHAQ